MDSSPDSFGSDLVSSWGADTLTISYGEALPCKVLPRRQDNPIPEPIGRGRDD